MRIKIVSARSLYGASLILGAVAIAELLFIFWPKVRPLGQLLDVIQVYLERLNPAFAGLVGDRVIAQTVLALTLTWIASYVAIEAFSWKTDGLSLWGNIYHDSCGRAKHGVRRKFCTASKWTATLFGSPFLIVWALIERIRFGKRIVTVGFVTVDPIIVVGYIKHLTLGLAMLVTILLLFPKPGTA